MTREEKSSMLKVKLDDMKYAKNRIENLEYHVNHLDKTISNLKDDIGYITKAFSYYRKQMSEVNKPLSGGPKYEI